MLGRLSPVHCVFWVFHYFFAMPFHPAALDGQLVVFSVSCMLNIEQGGTGKHKCVKIFEIKPKKIDMYFSISELEIQSLESRCIC